MTLRLPAGPRLSSARKLVPALPVDSGLKRPKLEVVEPKDPEHAQLTWEAWQARKQAEWEADQRALAEGRITREELAAKVRAVPEHMCKAPLPWDDILW